MTPNHNHEEGVSLIEYVLLVSLICVIGLFAIQDTGDEVTNTLCVSSGAIGDMRYGYSYNAELGCCGYTPSGFGGSFTCAQ